MTHDNTVWGLWVHGVGTQKPGFSSDAQKWLAAGLEPRKSYGQEVVWSGVLDAPEKTMMAEVGRRGSSNRPMQRLVIETLADALCYQNRLPEIFDCFDRAYVRLRAPGPVRLYAHSLGVVLSIAWLRARPKVQVDTLTSFGTNLELFHLGAEDKFECPAQVARGNWFNYFDEDDALGWPIRGWIPQAQDIEVSVGGWLGWSGLSHTGYFGSRRFWKRTVAGR